jgi:hypothetical protein
MSLTAAGSGLAGQRTTKMMVICNKATKCASLDHICADGHGAPHEAKIVRPYEFVYGKKQKVTCSECICRCHEGIGPARCVPVDRTVPVVSPQFQQGTEQA